LQKEGYPMQSEDIPYHDYLDRRFPAPVLVRAFGSWQILTSAAAGRFYLMVVNPQTQEDVAVCEYDTWTERQQDIQRLRNLRPGDDFGPLLPSRRQPPPTPPSFPAANVLPRPEI
jgi:hypothetical protein